MNATQIKQIRNSRRYYIPILNMLKNNGGELRDLSVIDELLPNYSDITSEEINFERTAKKTGTVWRPYVFARNFALKELQVAGYITYSRSKPVKLTAMALNSNMEESAIQKDIEQRAMAYWSKKTEERMAKHGSSGHTVDTDEMPETDMQIFDDEKLKNEILNKVLSLDPKKFESFSRGLLQKMGFDIDEDKGVKYTGDGGIDGFGYVLDSGSLRTSRVAIQCKRYTGHPVGSPEINNLRGAVSTHMADYGIFITTSYFSEDAEKLSREGGTPITLIDGKKLVNLMIDYEYKVHSVPTYVIDEDYFGE